MARFRKKPVEIEAVQWTGDNTNEVASFTGGISRPGGAGLIIPTLEGDHTASKGDWIIRGVKGEYYPCKPDIFAATYDAVTD